MQDTSKLMGAWRKLDGFGLLAQYYINVPKATSDRKIVKGQQEGRPFETDQKSEMSKVGMPLLKGPCQKPPNCQD